MDVEPSLLNQQVLWGVTFWRLGLAVVIVFLGFLSRRLIKSIFEGMLRRLAARTRAQWDDDVVELLPSPLAAVVQIALWFGAAAVLTLPLEPVNIRLFVYQGFQVALALACVWVIFRFIDVLGRALARFSSETENRLDDLLVPMMRKTLKVIVAVVAGVTIVQNLGYSITSVLASLGIGGLALALAARDTVANFFGSVVVFTDRPFQLGDWVQFGDVEGTVEEVGFRTTRIRRFDKALVTVPNHTFTSTAITNFTARKIRRLKFEVGVSYETSPAQMKTFVARLRELVAGHPGIDQAFHFVHFTAFGGSSLDVLVYCFTNTTVWTEYLAIQEDLHLKIMEIVEQLGLEIAFPTRTVYLRDEGWLDDEELRASGDGAP